MSQSSFTKTKYVTIILFLAAIILPKVIPLGLPILVSDRTMEVYDYMELIEDGSKVIVNLDVCPGGEIPVGTPLGAVILHGMEKNLKFIGVATVEPASGPMGKKIFLEWIDWEGAGYKYGEDYVYLGFIPGIESAMAAIATDFKGIVKEDIHGTSIDDLPVLQNIKDYRDFGAAILATDWSHYPAMYSRQWTREGLITICVSYGGLIPDILPYYPKSLNALMIGEQAAAEYEFILKKPGVAIMATDVLSTAQIMIILFIIGANVWPKGKSKQEVEI